MTRSEHLAWCKARALQYVTAGQAAQAVASMTSDLRKHPETEASGHGFMAALGLFAIKDGPVSVRTWIEGFN